MPRKITARFSFRFLSFLTKWLACVLTGVVLVGQALSAGIPTITLRATRAAILSDGRDSTEILAEVRDSSGNFVPDGTTVTFTTSLGLFQQSGVTATAQTRSGQARARLSGMQKGTATITAAVQGGGFQRMEILISDDPADLFQGNQFIVVDGRSSTLYDVGRRAVQATGRPRTDEDEPGARLLFRNYRIVAEALELDCSAAVVKAVGRVTLSRGTSKLQCGRLSFELNRGTGFGITEIDGRLRGVQVSGPDLKVEPVDGAIPTSRFEMSDFADSQLLVAAREIRVFPGEKLQFARPQFYQDGQRLMSLPFYSMPLYSQQLFTDQILNVGSAGLGLDLPLYYDLTPSSSGIFRVRYGERAGRSAYATRPGLSLDLTQGYNSLSASQRFTGEFGFTGVNRTDWGFRWMHNQEFSTSTRGSVFLDFPQHRNMFASANLNQQFGGFNLGVNGGYQRSLRGFSTSGANGDAYLETLPVKLGRTGYMMAVGATTSIIHNRTGGSSITSTTHGLQTRMFSPLVRLDRNTTLTNSFSVGNQWTSYGRGGLTTAASVTAIRTLGSSTSLQTTYDFLNQPTVGVIGSGKHRLNLLFNTTAGTKWNLFVGSNLILDSSSHSILGDLSYNFARRWRLAFATTIQKFAGASYEDFEIGIGRSVGPRELYLSYSTLNHRIFFDIQAGRF